MYFLIFNFQFLVANRVRTTNVHHHTNQSNGCWYIAFKMVCVRHLGLWKN